MKKLNPELLDRLPPQDLNAERWVIGSALLQPSSLDDLAEVVCRDDFHADAHRKLFGLLVSMHDRSEPIDIGLIVNRLRESGELEAVGGVSYIAEVMQGIPHAAHACHYAAIVAKKARYRRLIHAAAATLRDAYDAAAEPEEILNSLERDLVEIETAEHDGEPVPMTEAVAEAITKLDAVMARTRPAALMTGLTLFDEQIGGLFRGELFILAARPSVGKTSLACQIATHFAARKRPVLFVSLEMSAAELATRILCSKAGVSSRKIRTADISDKDQAQLASHAGPLATNWLRIYDRAGATVYDVRRQARRLKRQGLDLVVVDYLQRLTPSDRKANRYEQVGEMTRGLKELARELDVPVLCLAQLGREADKEPTPRLSHLRESGDIEADADVVAFLHTDKKHRGATPEADAYNDKPAKLQILKNRNGETGDFDLRWIPYRTLFECEERPFEGHEEFARYA